MREIKFRAWDKNRKIIVDVEDLSENSIGYKFNTRKGNTTTIHHKRKRRGYFNLMQYTGLKDKNGEEIYEGDIVAFEDSDGGYEYPDLVVNTGIVEYGGLGFYFTNRVAVEMADFYIKDGRFDDVEVIGNIYENPEMFEVEE